MTSFSKYSGYFVVETNYTIQVNNILVASAQIQILNCICSVNNSGFYKTNMADIFNSSNLIAGWSRKESDIVQLNGADFYLNDSIT